MSFKAKLKWHKDWKDIRYYSKKIETQKIKISPSPVNLKLTKSSDDLFPRCVSPVLAMKKALTEIISQISGNVNILQRTKLAFKALKICSEEESSYTKEMKLIVETLKSSIFIEKSKIDPEILSFIYEKYLDALIDKDLLIYMYVLEGYKSVLDHYKSENIHLKSSLSQKIAERKEDLKEKRIEIAKLQAKIEMDLTEPLRQKSQELRNLEEKYSKNLKNIEELRNLLTEKDEVIKKFKNQSSAHSRLIYDYQCNDEENRLKIKELTENLNQVSNELRKTQDENYRKQHNLEVALFKLKGILEKEKEMENRIQYLEEQNLVLSYRAGIGFENLTPRPSFIGIENLMMEFPQSTKKKVQKILEIAGNLVNSSKSSSSIRKKNKKVSLKNTTKITIESNSEHGDF